jgi:hypothetical protein
VSRPPSPPAPQGDRPLHPLPRGLVELYGLLAVLVVLVPEWMASGALLTLLGRQGAGALPSPTRAWRQLPELRLASMSLAELRLLACQLRLRGYAGQSREPLSGRLLQRIKRRKELW